MAGCTPEPGPVRLDLDGIRSSADVSDLSVVLTRAVTSDGRLKPPEAERLIHRLDSQLRKMAATGPTATPSLYPTDATRWAYWYNARVAWSIKLAALAGFSERVSARAMRRRRFPLDGRSMSLAQIDDVLLAEARRIGDFRLAACAPGACVQDAPLPNKPHLAEGFEARLGASFESLVLDARRFIVDVKRKRVRVPSMLWDVRGLLLRTYEQKYGPSGANLITTLRPHLGPRGRRRLDEALGYAVAPPQAACRLAIPKRRVYFPGKVGRIEP